MLTVSIKAGSRWKKEIRERIGDRAYRAKVGILDGATASGEKDNAGQLIAEYAFKNEYGDGKVPARPFMRSTVARCKPAWKSDLAKLMKHGLQPKEALQLVGDIVVTDVVQTIENGVPPPNAQRTVEEKRKRGRSEPNKTLIDTGEMEKAVKSEVVPA